MRRLSLASVIALTLSVTAPALAEPAPEPQAPTVATAAPAAAPSAPTVAAPAPPRAPTVTVSPARAPAAPVVAVAPTAVPAVVVAPAVALAPAPPAVALAPAPPAAPDAPLALRPAKELTLAAEPAPTPWPYKVLFGAIMLAAGFVVWRKRGALGAKATRSAAVRVLTRTSTGLRGELALVEVGGMRLLIGITPGSMQTLAILPDETSELIDESLRQEERTAAGAPGREPPKLELASRARSLFSSLDLGPPPGPRPPLPLPSSGYAASRYADERDIEPAPDSAPAPAERGARRRPARDKPLEGQARGLALALGNRR